MSTNGQATETTPRRNSLTGLSRASCANHIEKALTRRGGNHMASISRTGLCETAPPLLQEPQRIQQRPTAPDLEMEMGSC